MKPEYFAILLILCLFIGLSACVSSSSTPMPLEPPELSFSTPSVVPSPTISLDHLSAVTPSLTLTIPIHSSFSLSTSLSLNELPTISAPIGLLYRYDDKLWFVGSDGIPILITPHPYGYLAPDRQSVLYLDSVTLRHFAPNYMQSVS